MYVISKICDQNKTHTTWELPAFFFGKFTKWLDRLELVIPGFSVLSDWALYEEGVATSGCWPDSVDPFRSRVNKDVTSSGHHELPHPIVGRNRGLGKEIHGSPTQNRSIFNFSLAGRRGPGLLSDKVSPITIKIEPPVVSHLIRICTTLRFSIFSRKIPSVFLQRRLEGSFIGFFSRLH